jgi:hypothetical protein
VNAATILQLVDGSLAKMNTKTLCSASSRRVDAATRNLPKRSQQASSGHPPGGCPIPRESDEDDLWQVIEVLVACVQNQVVLQNKRGDPHVVGRNRRSLLPKLAKD